MNYTVYRITNPKGFSYIGITKDLKNRMRAYRGLQCKTQQRIYRSLNKYGYDTHKIEYLYQNIDEATANVLERALIEVYKSFKKSLNISDGGKTATDSSNLKKILQFSVDGTYLKEWSSAIEIEKELSFCRTQIWYVARSHSFYAKGFLWMLKEDTEKGVIPYWKYKSKCATKIHKVHQFDKSGKFIQTFNSVAEASKILNYCPGTIRSSLLKKSKISKDYIFSYEKCSIAPYTHRLLSNSKTVYVYDKDRNLVTICNSVTQVGEVLNFPRSGIYKALEKGNLFKKQYYFSYEQH